MKHSRKDLAEALVNVLPEVSRKMASSLPKPPIARQKMRFLYQVMINNGRSMKFFSEVMNISKPNLSKLVDSLENEGLITRKTHPKDRRKTVILMTETGKEITEEQYTSTTDEIAQILSTYTDEEVEKFYYHIEEITNLVQKVDDRNEA